MLKNLRKRFIGINMAIVAGMLLIIFALVFHFTKIDLEMKSDAMLQSLSQNFQSAPGQNSNILLPYLTIDITNKGEVLVTGNVKYDLSDSQFINELIETVNSTQRFSGVIDKYQLKYRVTTGKTGSRIALIDISSNRQALSSLLHISLIIGVLALGAFMLISILLARWAVKPVAHAWNQQKQFVSDASHELKTPLTVILSNAELLLSPDLTDPQRMQYSSNILSSSHQMRHLVEGMLDLTRADNGQIRSHFESTDLSQIVLESILNFEAVFFEHQLSIQSSIAPGIQVLGSQQHLRQLIDILLDNAQKYSAPGIVDVSFQFVNKNQCLLAVSNPGNPIPTEELQRIFQRFYRSDTARANTGSVGLGLSIAHRIAQEHNGHIWAESNPSGNCFYVLLPC